MQHPDLRQQGKWLKAIFNQEQIVKGGQLVVTAGLVVVLLIAVGCVSDAAGQVGQQFGIDIPLGGGGDSSGGADLEQCFIMIENWSETTLGAVNHTGRGSRMSISGPLDETVLEATTGGGKHSTVKQRLTGSTTRTKGCAHRLKQCALVHRAY